MSTQTNLLLKKIINHAVKAGASRLHFEVGSQPVMRVDQKLISLEDEAVISDEFLAEISKIILPASEQEILASKKSIVTTYTFEGNIRFKVHIFQQKNHLAMIFTYIPAVISDPKSIGLSQQFIDLLDQKTGLIVIAGYHSSGRTTTVLSLLNYINNTHSKYILTLERPIEYVLTSQKSIIEQREIGRDSNSFFSALKFCKDSDVDVVFLSEITDSLILESIFEIITSGRLVIIVSDADSAADVLARLVDLASEDEADKVRHNLAEHLLGVVVQQLVPRRGGGQITVTEILINNSAITSLIKEGRYNQLTSVIQTSHDEGMQSLDQTLLELVKTGEVEYAKGLEIATDKASFQAAAEKFRNK